MVAVVFIVSITVAVVVVVLILGLRNRRGHYYSTGTQKKYVMTFTSSLCFSFTCLLVLLCRGPVSAVDIPASTNAAYELSKLSR